MKNLFYTFLPILFLASCRAFDPETIVEGEVWNPALNKPVTGIPISLAEIPGIFSHRCCSEDVQTVYTDANGEYHFEPFKAHISSEYRVEFQNIDDWWYGHDNFYITKETTNYDSINAVARAKFYFGIINDTPSPDDTLWYRAQCLSMNWQAIGYGEEDAIQVGDVQLPGAAHPGSVPSGWYLFEWKVSRKGQKTYHQDSVWVENGTVYELHY